jgi:hypothetical protein
MAAEFVAPLVGLAFAVGIVVGIILRGWVH